MSLYVSVPISTEAIESNPDCQIRGFYENNQLVIEIDTRFEVKVFFQKNFNLEIKIITSA